MAREHDHSRLLVYVRALEAAAALDAVARAPECQEDLRDQLFRASASIVLNIAEGAGEFAPREKARFYRIAKRSAAECGAILDLIDRTGQLPAEGTRGKALLHEVAALLTRLLAALERRSLHNAGRGPDARSKNDLPR